MKFREGYLTLAVGVLAFALLTVWSSPMVHPFAWGDLCVAAGLRPPEDVFHGFGRGILTLLYAHLPGSLALPAAKLLGRLFVAGSVAGVYVVFRGFLPYVMNTDVHHMRIVMPVCRGIAAMTAVLFLCLDPIWRAGQVLTSVTVLVALGVVAMVCFMRFLQGGGLGPLYPGFLALGALSSDSLAGVPLSVAAILWLKSIAKSSDRFSDLSDELIWSILFKRLLKVWLLAWAVGLGVGVLMFVKHGGMKAVQFAGAVGFVPFYLTSLGRAVASSASFAGWFYGLLACIFPFVVACAMKRRAYGKDDFLPSGVETLFVLIAVGALMQIVAMSPLLSWCRVRQSMIVGSDSLLAVFQTFSLASLAIAAAVFGVDICCRNYRRIIKWRFLDSVDKQLPSGISRSLVRERGLRRSVFFSALVIVPCLAVSGQYKGVDREIARLVMRYVSEVVDECRGRDVVFTDGAFDPLVELCAHEKGASLVAVSTLSPNTPYERAVRARAIETDEDAALLANDGITALRTWIETGNSNRLARCAALVGGEFWKRQKISMPPVSGLAVVPGDPSPEMIERGRAAADDLSESVLAFCQGRKAAKSEDAHLRRLFPFVQWRLAQGQRLRSYVDALEHRYEASVKATEFAERLDSVNDSLAELKKNTFWRSMQNGGVLTPREALVIGLARADFKLAAYFAAPILKTDPDDVRANFAMGMKHYLAEEWALSEQYFKRCLKTRPDDPAILNNLANVQARLGLFAEAEANVGKALARLPDSPEILRSKSKIKELAAKAGKTK